MLCWWCILVGFFLFSLHCNLWHPFYFSILKILPWSFFIHFVLSRVFFSLLTACRIDMPLDSVTWSCDPVRERPSTTSCTVFPASSARYLKIRFVAAWVEVLELLLLLAAACFVTDPEDQLDRFYTWSKQHQLHCFWSSRATEAWCPESTFQWLLFVLSACLIFTHFKIIFEKVSTGAVLLFHAWA